MIRDFRQAVPFLRWRDVQPVSLPEAAHYKPVQSVSDTGGCRLSVAHRLLSFVPVLLGVHYIFSAP
jgi:hypothetical protein